MRTPYTYSQQKFKVNFGNILYFSSPQADWNQEDESALNYIRNKPVLVAGPNISLKKEGNNVIISATGNYEPDSPDTPDVPPEGGIEEIIEKALPIYISLNGESAEIEFKMLDVNTASHEENGFYIIDTATGKQIGYQLVLEPSIDGKSHTLFVPKSTPVINSYQYQPIIGEWLMMGFDETYWIYTGTEVHNVNGQEIEYNTYTYNSELWGDPIVVTEYWRFEVEV